MAPSDKQNKSAIAVLPHEVLQKFLLPPTHPTEGYTMICNPTGLKIKSNSYGDRKYGETDKV